MIYLLLGVALVVVKVVAKPLLLLQKKPPPEADKSPGPPKLAVNSYLLRELSALSGYLDFFQFIFLKHTGHGGELLHSFT